MIAYLLRAKGRNLTTDVPVGNNVQPPPQIIEDGVSYDLEMIDYRPTPYRNLAIYRESVLSNAESGEARSIVLSEIDAMLGISASR
jgi:hypothetical protein